MERAGWLRLEFDPRKVLLTEPRGALRQELSHGHVDASRSELASNGHRIDGWLANFAAGSAEPTHESHSAVEAGAR